MGDLSENFNRKEFECSCGCGFDTVDHELILVDEDLRNHFGRPVIITSACRCLEYNRSVGSNDNSQHPKGKANDVIVSGVEASKVYEYLHNKYYNKYGIGKYKDFTHVDVRQNKARWEGRK